MKDTVYIVFNRNAVDRMTKREPGLARGEKMVLVDIEAPDSLWDPLPRLHARLEVAAGHSQDPATIVLDPHDSPTISKGDFGQRHMKRLFVIARCDGEPIVWPTPTHGPGLKPFRTAAECIDWTLPMCSIFATKEEAREWAHYHGQACPQRPLKDATMRRIARGIMRYVVDADKPFFVTIAHAEVSPSGVKRWGSGARSTEEPLSTISCKGETALVSPLIAGVGGRAGQSPERSVDSPAGTLTSKADAALISPFCVPRYGERSGQAPRCGQVDKPSPVIVPTANGQSVVAANFATYYGEKEGANPRANAVDELLPTLSTENRFGVVASFMAQHNGGFFAENEGRSIGDPVSTICNRGTNQGVVAGFCMTNTNGHAGAPLDAQVPTITTGGHHALLAGHIQRDFGTSTGSKADAAIGTITCDGGGHAALVASLLTEYYGTGSAASVDDPLATITTKDRLGVACAHLWSDGMVRLRSHPDLFIADIGMRMLQPRELYLCQGFRPSYIIDHGINGKPLSKGAQVRMCGNSVCPPVAEALVRANVPELIVRSAPKAPKRVKVAA